MAWRKSAIDRILETMLVGDTRWLGPRDFGLDGTLFHAEVRSWQGAGDRFVVLVEHLSVETAEQLVDAVRIKRTR